MIYNWTEGDVTREETVLTKDLDEFYVWLAFKNLDNAKEKYLYEQEKAKTKLNH